MDMIGDSLYISAGMIWKALWALVFGYLVSSGVQVLVTHSQMGRLLGDRGPRQAGLAGLFGFISSSCSFAALATTRSIWAKGAHPANAIVFLISATNLVIELGIVLWVLLGWQFFLANILLGLFMILYAYLLTRWHFPDQMADDALRHSEDQQEGGMGDMENDEGWRAIFTRKGWLQLSHRFFMEWAMVYKEILFGFLIAGAISTFVSDRVWGSLFLKVNSPWDVVPIVQNTLMAPVVAFFTFIGSMGNVPLAAMLWSKDVSFAGVMAFLGADLVAATVIYIRFKYYGAKYTAYLSLLLFVTPVLAAISVHVVFATLGLIPDVRESLEDMVAFRLDYTFWLNVVFGVVGIGLMILHLRHRSDKQQ